MRKIVLLITVLLTCILVLAGCATAPDAASAKTSTDKTFVTPVAVNNEWIGKIEKPDHLTSDFMYVPNSQDPNSFRFENKSYGRSAYEAVFQKALAALPELNAKPYTYEDLFAGLGLPTSIEVYKSGSAEHLNWHYGSIQFYIGPAGTKVIEARMTGMIDGFAWKSLRLGDPAEKIAETIGPVLETVTGKNEWKEQILYLNKEGSGYFSNSSKGVRVFIQNGKIAAVYVFPAK